jgi:hypothetical protein
MALSALAIPETRVALIFFPLYPIPINVGVSALVCLDVLGIIRGWRFALLMSFHGNELTICAFEKGQRKAVLRDPLLRMLIFASA